MTTKEARQRQLRGLVPNMGRGRKKGVKNRATLVKDVAKAIIRSAIMEKTELLERLSRVGRSDIGLHLTMDAQGEAQLKVDPRHTDIIREITVKPGLLGPETKVKVADPLPALSELAEIYGLKKQQAPAVDMSVLIQMLKVNVTQDRLLEIAEAALAQED